MNQVQDKDRDMPRCDGITQIEDLAELRSTLEIWVARAAGAVWKFRRGTDGSFWTNSDKAAEEEREAARRRANNEEAAPPRPHVTTTARCFVALQNAHRSRGDDLRPTVKEWVTLFDTFIADFPMQWTEKEAFSEGASAEADENAGGSRKKSKVNTFDVAHVADFFQVAEYIERFGLNPKEGSIEKSAEKPTAEDAPQTEAEKPLEEEQSSASPTALSPELREAVIEHLTQAIQQSTAAAQTATPHTGEVCFDTRAESAHFFATLHALRGLHALRAPVPANIGAVVEGARSFAVEQCYYYQRGATHRQDALRLAFAGSIYALYGEHVDQDLCLAIIEALHQAQQDNGSWPATHPVLRQNDRPWHIASHEVALCLTWLYFQPKVPDSARPLLVSMLRRYLLDAVAPTFINAPSRASPDGLKRSFDGWQDDHTVGTESTVGWATAIICHFLANFSQVLDDWINRRVIEDLDLQLITKDYIIDDVVGDPAPRWQRGLKGSTHTEILVEERDLEGTPILGEDGRNKIIALPRDAGEVWPDLPPHAWSCNPIKDEDLARSIYTEWTDPSLDNAISRGVAELVLLPLFANPDQRPAKGQYAGLLPGAPGTRKTSLVNKIASTVMWPKVAVPASLIFAKGFDMMEAQANAVFDRLNHLRRCVIFFDEFEEFFVKRQEDDKVDPADKHRTIAAFTTSAMLPRLQELHDVRRCLLFLATNNNKKIDPAIKRRGRFDFMIEVNHPTRERLIQYLDELPPRTRKQTKLDQLESGAENLVVKAVRTALEMDSRDVPIRFAWIEQILETYQKVDDPEFQTKVGKAYNNLTQVKDDEDPPKIEDLLAAGPTAADSAKKKISSRKQK